MSDVELVRRAAGLIREHAEAATPGDPDHHGYVAHVLGSEGYAVMGAPRAGRRIGRTVVARCGMNDWDTDKANAQHIASWHPAVALAVARWLESIAHNWAAQSEGCQADAVDVARAYLCEVP